VSESFVFADAWELQLFLVTLRESFEHEAGIVHQRHHLVPAISQALSSQRIVRHVSIHLQTTYSVLFKKTSTI